MTVFSTEGEKVNELKWGHKLGFYPEQVLRDLGANVIESSKGPYSPNVITDGNLITGENPQSASLLAKTFVQALNRKVF